MKHIGLCVIFMCLQTELVVSMYTKSCTLCCLLTMYTIANQQPTVVFIRTLLFLSFCYAPKRPSPAKKPSFNDKV